jgi:protein-S-isoprenylcysteine O-methyltransferase Ste14
MPPDLDASAPWRDPWFWAFLAALGWFFGLCLIGAKPPRGSFALGAACFILAQVPRLILPLPLVIQPRIDIERWILIVAGVIVVSVTLPFTLAAFQVKPWLPVNARQPLRTSGLYGIVRHPLMFRDAFWPLGWSLIFASTIGAALTVVWFLVCWLFTFVEERHLREVYGSEYEEYRRRVPRLLPFLGWRQPRS